MTANVLHIIGAGGYARCIADVACVSGYASVIFFDRDVRGHPSMMGYEVRDEEELSQLPQQSYVVVGIGDNSARERIVQHLKTVRSDLIFPVLIHPRASVSAHSEIGAGSVVMAGAVVGPCVSIGEHVSIYSGAIVEHDSKLADFVTLGPAAATGGTVSLGERTFLGLGSTVNHNLIIGPDTVVGSGASVTVSFTGGVVLVGVPARVIRSHKQFDKYL